ncbi:hypothetical protein GOZ81_10425 [Agrobacterium vitis]|uniref:hypothetical protein n=1 Tax=Agrobacterium vitis TaxID=373 RepID=UPI0012E8DD4C|nr:hypothetical protein [Agrobacterium vitis]MVA71490.1 hypothetical protein [Agrobacterium vitis]
MFSIIPYSAKREVYTKQPDGSMKSSWNPCRVIGIEIGQDQLAPRYVVEYQVGGVTHLGLEECIRKLEPGSPL